MLIIIIIVVVVVVVAFVEMFSVETSKNPPDPQCNSIVRNLDYDIPGIEFEVVSLTTLGRFDNGWVFLI